MVGGAHFPRIFDMMPPRPRFTVRRLMSAIAVVGLVLGLGIWSARMCERWRYCHEMARRHAFGARVIQEHRGNEVQRVSNLDSVARRFSEMTPEPRPIDDLVRDSGDPTFAAWFVKNQARRRLLAEDRTVVSPREFIDFIEYYWGLNWRTTASALSHALATHRRLEREYRAAAFNPWKEIPRDPPPHAVD